MAMLGDIEGMDKHARARTGDIQRIFIRGRRPAHSGIHPAVAITLLPAGAARNTGELSMFRPSSAICIPGVVKSMFP